MQTQGKLDEAEKMYMRALEGSEKAIGPENILTFMPALNTMFNLAHLFDRQDKVRDARTLYLKALSGFQKVVGDDHSMCQALRNNLAALGKKGDKISATTKRESVRAHSQPQTIGASGARRSPPTSRKHKILKILGLKRT